MAGVGATLLIAYAVEMSAVVRADYVRTQRRATWIGWVVGISTCGLVAIVASLALAERAAVEHWTWVDSLALSFSAMALLMLGLLVALLPALYQEWWRMRHVDADDGD